MVSATSKPRLIATLVMVCILLVFQCRFAIKLNSVTSYRDGDAYPTKAISTAIAAAPTVSAMNARDKNESLSAGEWLLPPKGKWIKDIGLELVRGCGYSKCAFGSITAEQNNVGSFGYLATIDLDDNTNSKVSSATLSEASKSYELAQNLTADFGLGHALLGPPRRFVRRKPGKRNYNQFFQRLARKTTKPTPGYVKKKRRWLNSNTSSVVVQPIELYSDESVLLKCTSGEKGYKEALERVDGLGRPSFGLVDEIGDDDTGSDDSIDAYALELRGDYRRTMDAMNSSRYACLRKDFQVVLDPLKGRLWHIDFERCFDDRNKDRWDSDCRSWLYDLVEATIERRKQPNTNTTTNTPKQPKPKRRKKSRPTKQPGTKPKPQPKRRRRRRRRRPQTKPTQKPVGEVSN